MNIKKFYDADQATGGGSEPQSIAALMAKEGSMSHSENSVATLVGGRNEETASTNPAPVETTNGGNVAEVESEAPISAKVEEQAPTQVQQQWQEVLRQQQPEAILKELGFNENAVGFLKELKDVDPKMVQFFNMWKSDGDSLKDYLKEMTTDYSQLSSEDVMRRQLREEYPKATEKQLEVLFRKEIVERYNLDSMDEELVEEGKLLLDAKAESFRDKLTQKQQEYLLPQYTQDNSASESEMRAQQEFENYKHNLTSNQLTQEMLQNKRLTIGEGDEKFNYSVTNPNNIVNNLFDSNAWATKLFDIQKDSQGNEQFVPNVEKQLLVSAILEDHKGFLKEMAKYYKSLGGKATIDSLDNPSPTGTSSPSKPMADPKSPAEWMARSGRLV
jgi:hypothetical protein